MLELKNMLKEKSVKLELTNEAIDYPVENGYDSKMGARSCNVLQMIRSSNR